MEIQSLDSINSNLSNLQKLDYSKKQLANASFVASRDGIICGYVNLNTSSSGYYQINIDSLPIYFTTSSQGQSIPVYALINKGQNVIIASSECEINAYFVPFV